MSYIINKTDGSVLTEVVDGTVDQTSTDLTLIGKNASSYGEFFNENLIRLLENFANTSSPSNPIQGQLWYDTTEGRLKVYDGNGFRVSGGTIVSNKVPNNLVQGDIWIDSYRKQLFFYDGTQLTLSGPQFTDQQGLTGLTIESVLDTNQLSHTLAIMYVGQVLIGIWSKDQFTPAAPIAGAKPGIIYKGFNIGSLSGAEFKVIASQARGLIAADGSNKVPEDFVSVTDPETIFQGKVYINNTLPLTLGPGPSTEIRVTNTEFNITPLQSGQEVVLKVKNSGGIKSAIHIKPTTEYVGIFTAAPEAMLDVNGDTIVRGNLTVKGSTTTFETNNVSIEDIAIELAKTASPNDISADGAGIIVKGTTDHTITWIRDGIDITDSNWTFSENLSLDAGKSYKINNVMVIDDTGLGNTIVTAPGLRSVGNLFSLGVDNLSLNDNTISSTDTDGDIIISPAGTGKVSVASSIISNLADPVDPTDAVNFQFMEEYIQTKPLGFSLDITGLSAVNTARRLQIAKILTDVFPVVSHPNGASCRVYCTKQSISFPALDISSGVITTNESVIQAPGAAGILVTVPGGEATIYGVVPGSVASVVQDITVNPVNTGPATIAYTRTIEVYEVVAGAWTWDSDEAATPL